VPVFRQTAAAGGLSLDAKSAAVVKVLHEVLVASGHFDESVPGIVLRGHCHRLTA